MVTVASQVSKYMGNVVTVSNIWGGIIINVKASPYLAKGDGVTDDTAAIQAAVDYAISIGKSEVTMPAGTYLYTVLTNTSGITFIGDGVTLNGTTTLNLTSLASLAADFTLLETDGLQVGVGTKHGYFSILAIRTTIDYHAYEDWGILNTTDTALGYSSFDAKPTLNNSLDQNHLVGYQSRPIYTGAGNLTNYLHGYDYKAVHNGTGTIVNAYGLYIYDVQGTGPITNNYGIYIENMTRGTNDYAIYSVGDKNYFGGILSNVTAFGLNFGVDVASKSMAIGFGTAGQANFGTIDFYNGKNGLVFRVDQTGIAVNESVSVAKTFRLGQYTLASLPSSAEGTLAYCTNGRKTGEGAGVGTGVCVYYSLGAWRRFYDDATVTA